MCTSLLAQLRFMSGKYGNFSQWRAHEIRIYRFYMTLWWMFWDHWWMLDLQDLSGTEWGRMHTPASPISVSSCWDIGKGKDMACVKHGIAVPNPCVRCLDTMHDIRELLQKRWTTDKRAYAYQRSIRSDIGQIWEDGKETRLEIATDLGSGCPK